MSPGAVVGQGYRAALGDRTADGHPCPAGSLPPSAPGAAQGIRARLPAVTASTAPATLVTSGVREVGRSGAWSSGSAWSPARVSAVTADSVSGATGSFLPRKRRTGVPVRSARFRPRRGKSSARGVRTDAFAMPGIVRGRTRGAGMVPRAGRGGGGGPTAARAAGVGPARRGGAGTSRRYGARGRVTCAGYAPRCRTGRCQPMNFLNSSGSSKFCGAWGRPGAPPCSRRAASSCSCCLRFIGLPERCLPFAALTFFF